MTRKYSVKEISKLVWHELKANKFQATNNMVAGLVVVGLEFLFVWLTKQTVDIAEKPEAPHIFAFWTAVGLLIATLAMQLIIGAYRNWVNAMLSIKATNKMQIDLFRHTLLTPWQDLKAYHSGDIINRIEKDVATIVHIVTDTLPAFVTICTQFVGAFIFLLLMDKTLALFIVIILPFFIVIAKLYVKKMRQLTRQIRDTDSRMQAQYQEGINNRVVIKTIKGGVGVILCRLLKTQDRIVRLVRQRARFSVTSNLIMNIGFAAAYLFTFVWGANQLRNHLITFGTLIAFVQLVGQIQRPARNLVKFIPEIISALTAGERLLDIKRLPKEETEKMDNEATNNEKLGVKVDNVTFGYNKDRHILQDFSCDFKPGSRVAIMGQTGQGKTTLIRLMLTLLQPQEGAITIYGNKTSTPADIHTRRLFAYVPQGNTLFSGSIRSNLKLAAPEATDEQLLDTLRMVKAEFVFNLPEGLNSQCGEHGVSLSEGQAQRLCIARAILVGAPILLLDEATSALDAQTEADVLKNICNSLTDTTIICVSHRPKVLEYCSEVINL